mgnify:CR=1 FL=1
MNVPELRAEIARANIKHKVIAETLGISKQAFLNKMNGNSEFKASEIRTLAEMLNLPLEKVSYIFFETSVN